MIVFCCYCTVVAMSDSFALLPISRFQCWLIITQTRRGPHVHRTTRVLSLQTPSCILHKQLASYRAAAPAALLEFKFQSQKAMSRSAMVQPPPPLLVRILQLTLLLYMCELTSATPLLDDVAPQRVRIRPPPQADPETVFLPDGSCCYDYEAYTFCLNPPSTPPRSACVQLCGNSLCVFRRQFDNDDEDHEAELVGLVESDIVDIHSLAQGSRRGCCTCVKSFVKVCLQPADEGLTCSSAVCGYKLCFGYCVE